MFMDACESEPNFTSLLECRVTKVTPEGVHYADKEGNEHLAACGSVVLAAGMRGKLDEAFAFSTAGKQFYAIGDCLKAGSVQKCMRSAYDIANTI